MATATNLIEFPPPLPKPERIQRQPAKPKQHKVEATYLDLPPEATHGYLGGAARSLEGPLGWCYCACLGIYAGMNGKCSDDVNDPYNEERANLYVALLGDVGSGKSIAIRRAQRVLQPCSLHVRKATPASDHGLYSMFAKPEDGLPFSVPSVVLALDELKDLFQKINIQNASLAQALCSLYNDDSVGSWVKNTHNEACVRLSICGALKSKDIGDFQTIFGPNTTDGLYTRFIICPPGVEKPDWDLTWKPDYPRPKVGKVTIQDKDKNAVKAWRLKYEELGFQPTRIQEIALRVATLTAAANGETTISDACMEAALVFAGWQAESKYGYQPGQAVDDNARLSAAMIATFKSLGRDADGKPTRVLYSKIAQKKNWHKIYGGDRVESQKRALDKGDVIILECFPSREDYLANAYQEPSNSVRELHPLPEPRSLSQCGARTGYAWLNPAWFED